MKKLVFSGLATLSLALGAFGQGAVDINNEFAANGVAINAAGDYYSGPYGVEIWELNGATIPGNVNSAANLDAYASLSAYGFTLADTVFGQDMSDPGTFILGSVNMPGVTPAGSEVVLALAVWTGDYPSWSAAVSAGAKGGVVALVNQTVNYLAKPPPIPPDLAAGWDAYGKDLVMTKFAHSTSTPPVLASLANQRVYAGSTLSFTASATDTNQPPRTLTFSLSSGAPAGASITAGGLFTWTPTVAQAPSTNLITVIVTDNGAPPLSASASFKVVVLPPMGAAALEMDNADAAYGIASGKRGNYYTGAYGLELWVLNGTSVPASINSATNVAAHGDLAAAGFTLAQTWSGQTMGAEFPGTLLLGGVALPMVKPAGSDVVLALAAWSGDAASWAAAVAAGAEGGVIAFVNQTVDPSILPPPVPPDLAAGWDAYGADLVMTPLGASASSTPPVLAPLANQRVYAGSLLSFTASATDTNQPPRTLTFSLGSSAPVGASITAGGLFTWTPTAAQAPSTNLITVIVTDNGAPPLSASASFKVVVLPAISAAALEMDNADAAYGIASGKRGNYYTGAYGLELWVLNGTSVPASINSATNVAAYSDLAAAGFTLAQTWSGQTMGAEFPGTLLLAGVALPMVKPPGSEVVLALAAWSGDAASWAAAVAAGAEGGVVAFVNQTVDPSILPPPVPPDLATGWDAYGADLVMTPLGASAPSTPPVLAPLANQRVYAGSTLSFTASATDTNQPPRTLTFSLGSAAPAGASITAGGLFTWTPTVAQAPSTNLITVTVTDNGAPPLSASASFKVVVLPPMGAAALEVDNADAEYGIASGKRGNYYTGAYGLELWVLNGTSVPASINSATNVAAYGDLAAAGFTLAQTWSAQTMGAEFPGTLLLGGVALPMVKPPGSEVVLALAAWTGEATNWTAAAAAEAQGGVVAFVNQTVDTSILPPPVPPDLAAGWDAYGADLVMTPMAAPAPNTPPVLPVISAQTVNELTLLTVANTATESNIHSTLSYALVNPPAGMTISANGVITWTPQQSQSPSTNLVTTIVTSSDPYDLVNPRLAATNTFTVIVREVNVAPVPAVIGAQTINELTLLTVANTATESNIHSTLGYALVNPPAGMTISANGVITWTPQQSQSPSTNLVTTVVTSSDPDDLVNPRLAATNTFTVIVREVNVAPVLPVIGAQAVNELTPLTVANTATESNIHSTLGYTLVNPPAGMTISANGVITWTPQQSQSPSTNLVTTIVTSSDLYDPVNPQLAATNTFTVIVREVNVAPVLAAIGAQTVNELTLLTVANTATESNIHSTLSYALVNPPAGMTISASGVITWTPQQSQSPSTNLVTTVVTSSNPYDLLNPELAAANTFTVIVREVNVAPVLPAIGAQTVNELTLLTVANTATESNIHSTLGYALVNPPAGMTISASGVITWTPQRSQSPSTNLVTTIVTSSNPYDLLNPHLSATNTFTVIVREVNLAPVLPAIGAQTVNELTLLTVTNTARESNIHSTLSYALVNAPEGMTISANGVISWTPQQSQSPSTNLITTIVTSSNPYDLLNPHLDAANTFTVIVKEAPAQLGIGLVGSRPHLMWNATAGWRYQVWYKEAMGDTSWVSIGPVTVASGDTLEFTDSSAAENHARFYRVQVLGPQ